MRKLTLMIVLAAFSLLAPMAPSVAGGGCHAPTMASTDARGTIVEMKLACFSPTVVRIDQGQSVTFVNRDDLEHIVAGTGWGSGRLSLGGEYSLRFDRSGIYPFTCFLHQGMNGAVVVGDGIPDAGTVDSPVVLTSDEDNEFEGRSHLTTVKAAKVTSDGGMGGASVALIAVVAAMGGFSAASLLRRNGRPSGSS